MFKFTKSFVNRLRAALIVVSVTSACVAIGGCSTRSSSGSQLEQLSAPTNIYVEYNTLKWDMVDNAISYKIVINGSEYSSPICQYDISSFTANKKYSVEVYALSDGTTYRDSDGISYSFVYSKTSLPASSQYLQYTLLDDGSGYSVGLSEIEDEVKVSITEVYIPDFYENLPVKKIDDDGFTFVDEDSAALGSTDKTLTSIKLPRFLEEIGEYAFACNANLASFTIPDTVKTIGSYSFTYCQRISTLQIPASVESIEEGAFYACTSLARVTFIEGIKSIGEGAFAATVLTSVSLPQSLENLGEAAFLFCTKLQSVTLSDNITSLGGGIFYYTKFLTNKINQSSSPYITLNNKYIIAYNGDSSDTVIDDIPENMYICGRLFSSDYCSVSSSITEVVIPENKYLGEGLFDGCSKLTSVTFPTGITEIPAETFRGCTSLTEYTVPSTVKTIGEGAFYGCTALAQITLPEGLETIESYLFRNCTSLTEITIPATVTSIGSYAFCGCTGFTTFTIPSTIKTIGAGAFYGCTKLTAITLPEGLETIESYLFVNCTSLTTITIPATVTSIGAYAFYSCKALTEITLPTTLKSIGDAAFYRCTSLTKIEIPDSVESIGSGVFVSCSKLSEVVIGVGQAKDLSYLTSYLSYMSLTTIDFRGTEAEWLATVPEENRTILTENGVTIVYNYSSAAA